jgi:hypothetical protein
LGGGSEAGTGAGEGAAAIAKPRRSPDGQRGAAIAGDWRVRRSATAAGNLAAARVAWAMKGRRKRKRKWAARLKVHWCSTTSKRGQRREKKKKKKTSRPRKRRTDTDADG